jgi:hypothetical protein
MVYPGKVKESYCKHNPSPVIKQAQRRARWRLFEFKLLGYSNYCFSRAPQAFAKKSYKLSLTLVIETINNKSGLSAEYFKM